MNPFILSRFIRPGPIYLVYLVTARCNMRCPACFNWQRADQAEPGRELTPDEAGRFARSLPPLYQLTFGGGEPFLRNDLTELVTMVANACRPASITITTNGWLTETIASQVAMMAQSLPQRYVRIAVSLDGLEETHDRLREAGSFRRATATITALAELGKTLPNLGVDVNTCVSRDNLGGVKDLIDWVRRNLPVTNHNLCLVRGATRDPNAGGLNPERYRELVEYLWAQWPVPEKRPLSSLIRSVFNEFNHLAAATASAQRQLIPCRAGRRVVSLFEDGTLAPCELLDRPFGNIRDFDYNFKKITTTPEALAILDFIRQKKCWCTWECAFAASLPYHLPALTRIIRRALASIFSRDNIATP